jgi:hypothetical protein
MAGSKPNGGLQPQDPYSRGLMAVRIPVQSGSALLR